MYWETGAQSARCTTLREWQLRAPSVTKQPGYPEKAEEKNKGKDLFLLSHGAHWEVGRILTCGSPMAMVVVFCPTFRWGSAVQLLKQEMDSEFVFDAELKGESRKLLTRFFGSMGGRSQQQREWPLLHRKKIEREEVLGTRAPAASSEEDEELSHSLSETRAFLSNT